MPITSGVHHLTIFTSDIDRLGRFYTGHFEGKVMFDLSEPAPGGGTLRHMLIDLGGGFALHPFQMPVLTGQENAHHDMAHRGHLDHFALKVESEAVLQTVRHRLVDAGASDGKITDFGAVRLITFRDPDGMEGEVAVWTDKHEVLSFQDRKHEPMLA